jgi:hypothetical protein
MKPRELKVCVVDAVKMLPATSPPWNVAVPVVPVK